jgi:hypothetical protein
MVFTHREDQDEILPDPTEKTLMSIKWSSCADHYSRKIPSKNLWKHANTLK